MVAFKSQVKGDIFKDSQQWDDCQNNMDDSEGLQGVRRQGKEGC